jgi:predicted Zn-dependent protease
MGFSKAVRIAALIGALAALAACDSAEERAEKHYQNAVQLLAAGDMDRALVELRNVFALDESHRAARVAYAKTARKKGNLRDSYANYLRVVEQFPDDLESRLALTEMAIQTQNWSEAERHGALLIQANAEVAGQDVAELALRFRKAALDEEMPQVRELTREAAELYKTTPESSILQRMLIEGYSRQDDVAAAIEVADQAIALTPDDRSLYLIKATLLNRQGDVEKLEEHLRATIARFPDDNETKSVLIRLLASRGETDAAETFLRDEVARAENPDSFHVTLISFLQQTRGDAAALEELDVAIATYSENHIFRALKAGILFDMGNREEAVALMQSVVDGSEPGDESERFKISLAKMLVATGNEVGARQLVEEVLAGDPTMVDALKMSANWMIESDQADAAINALRTALDQEPEDAEAMTLMARAHQRNGDANLAQDLLALAVEASGNAPDESLRFATLLIEDERYRPAEDVLINALRATPGHVALLRLLGQVHLATEDWPRAAQVEATLRSQASPQAKQVADDLQLQIVSRREGREQAVGYLEQLIAQEDGNTAAKFALIRARLSEGASDEALALANDVVAEFPDNPRAKLVLANTQFALRNFDAAETLFREVLAETGDDAIAIQLVRVLSAQGRSDDARVALDAALEKIPDSRNLLWAKATFLERANDIDGALAIYETLYTQNSNSLIVANNLASLLATYRDDDASLERAFTVARRLRGTEVPPFQDTYGWILFRRGETAEALTYLESAANSLASDPIVQYHLARAYEELGRSEDALAAYRRAVEIADDDDPRSQIVDATARIKTLSP